MTYEMIDLSHNVCRVCGAPATQFLSGHVAQTPIGGYFCNEHGSHFESPYPAVTFSYIPALNTTGTAPAILPYGFDARVGEPIRYYPAPMESVTAPNDHIHLIAVCPHCHQKLMVDSNRAGTQVTTEALPEEQEP